MAEYRSDEALYLADKIKSDKLLLSEYLKKISRLEINIFELKERYNFLDEKYQNAASTQLARLSMKSIRKEEFKIKEPICPDAPGEKPDEPILQKPGLFNKKQVEIDNQRKLAEYKDSLERYNSSVSVYNQEMAIYEESLSNYNKALKEYEKKGKKTEKENIERAVNNTREIQNSILQEVNILKSELGRTIKTLSELYNFGIIYEKYRDGVAVSTFYDYFMSGRCSTFEGPTGAYNLYEQETRANIVINRLDGVLNSLEKIQVGQYYLYKELKAANMSLDLIYGQLLIDNLISAAQLMTSQNIEANTAEISQNSNIVAFYAKKNADLTDALGFMTAHK